MHSGKKSNQTKKKVIYEDITLPKNTPLGIYVAIFCFLAGFAFVWHIFWLAAVGIVGAIVCVIQRTFDEETEYVLPAAKVKELEERRVYGRKS